MDRSRLQHAIRNYADGDPELIRMLDMELDQHLAGEIPFCDLSEEAKGVMDELDAPYLKQR